MSAWDDLAGALAGVPLLAGAACRGLTWMGDLDAGSDPDDIAAGISVCAACPALAPCREWVESLSPRRRPSGVVAGMLLLPGVKVLPEPFVPPQAEAAS